MLLVKNIVHQARFHEFRPAIAFPGGVATYAVLMNSTWAAVEVLQTLGLPKGAIVVLDIRNPVFHVAMMFALALLGYPSASVGTAYSAASAGPRPHLFLTDREDVDGAGLTMLRLDPNWFTFPLGQPVPYAKLLGLAGFPSPDSVARILYSSGTTGRPKCVALTVDMLQKRAEKHGMYTPIRGREGAMVNMLGFSTVFGTTVPFWVLGGGSALCVTSSGPDALQLAHLFGASMVGGSVVQIESMLDALGDQPGPPALTRLLVGGALVPPSLLARAAARLTNNVQVGYGSTELGIVAIGTYGQIGDELGAVGYVPPWVEVEAVDAQGMTLPRGSEGVLRVRTDALALYLDDQGRPLPVPDGGWFYPGDLGRIEADSRLVITGRSTDIINRGGVIVAPEAIEEVLRANPGIRDVAVVGVTNARGIEEIWAALVSDAPFDAEVLLRAARVRLNERVPDRFFRLDTIPRNENGKVVRTALREQLQRLVG